MPSAARFFKILMSWQGETLEGTRPRKERTMAKGRSSGKVYKSAKTGRFVSKTYVKNHPTTTVTQTTKK